jgi:Rod binding domain-containing protein
LSGPIAPGQPGSPPSSQSLHKPEPPAIDPKKHAENVEAAKGFEGMFLDYMMQVMRQTVPKNEMDLENGATDIYRSMLDSEYVQKAVQQGGIGLADQLVAYLEGRSYNIPRGSTDSGGSHAGKPDQR